MHLVWQTTILAALTGVVNAAVPQEKRQLFAAPSAVIKNGTVVGSTDNVNNVDNFMGIEYALQPTGTRRLSNPSSITSGFGTFTATGNPTACPGYVVSSTTGSGANAAAQTLVNTSPVFTSSSTTGENCLNLNVQRTHGLTASNRAPVLLYIYGGGFIEGSTSTYDGTPIITKASSLGLPLVYVAISYRLAALGFLPGKEMRGNANLGLKDQRLALKWVHENIAAFGGDPNKVTIWGESAGAISCFDQLIVNGGDISYNGGSLFRGAIMNSGSAVPALDISAPYNQKIYDQVVANANCSGTPDTLACLRSVSSQTIIAAQATEPGIFDYPSLHLAYFPRPDASDNFYPASPETVLQTNAYAKVPIIIGDQEDEGTLFAQVQNNITNNDQLIAYMTTYFPEADPNDVKTLVNSYPDDPSYGSPFRTGTNNNEYPEFKRLAAILGDIVFTLIRRAYLQFATSRGVVAYSYINTYMYNTSPLGTFHGADVVNDRTLAISPVAQNATQDYFISFTYYQDPNAIAPTVKWPKYDNTSRQLLNFTFTSVDIGTDYFREPQYQTLLSLANKLHA